MSVRSLLVRLLQASLLGLTGIVGGCSGSNAPYDPGLLSENLLITSYGETPKHLDSAASYSNNETPWTYAIYEPALRYHYLKRPYQLEPRTLTRMPEVQYVDVAGRPLPANTPAGQVAETWLDLDLQPGILFSPHPAFARDSAGQLRYHHLRREDLHGKLRPLDLGDPGSRELTAYDYAYAIKRLASPRVRSPAYGFLSEKILGFADFGRRLKAIHETQRAEAERRAGGVLRIDSDGLPWLDLRDQDFPGVEVLDAHRLRIKLVGVYPQFKYWLAMTFFAPVAWEVDAFYAQAGMAAQNFSPDTWPVGTGPFMLTENRPSARMVVRRNPNYRGLPYPCEGEAGDEARGLLRDCGKTTPFVDGMVSIQDKEGSSVFTKFIQGYYDTPAIERGESAVAFQIAIEDKTGRAQDLIDRKVSLPSTTQVGINYFGFNWLDPVVGRGDTPEQQGRNRALRQAIAMAFDFEEYVAVFEDNRARVNQSIVVDGLFGHDAIGPNPVIYRAEGQGPAGPTADRPAGGSTVQPRLVRRSLDEARKKLAEAGYPNGRDARTGQPLVINFDTTGVGPAYKARLDWVSKQFAKLNIQLELRNTDYNRFQDKMRRGAYQFFFWGWLADYPDPENFLFLLYGPNGKVATQGENAANWQNDAFDRHFEAMRNLDDGPQRLALIGEMGRIMQDDLPLLYGWSEEYGGAYHQWLSNGKPSNIIRDNLPYLRVDAQQRVALVKEWNQPVLWPLALLPLLIGGVAWASWRGWRRRQSQRGRP